MHRVPPMCRHTGDVCRAQAVGLVAQAELLAAEAAQISTTGEDGSAPPEDGTAPPPSSVAGKCLIRCALLELSILLLVFPACPQCVGLLPGGRRVVS